MISIFYYFVLDLKTKTSCKFIAIFFTVAAKSKGNLKFVVAVHEYSKLSMLFQLQMGVPSTIGNSQTRLTAATSITNIPNLVIKLCGWGTPLHPGCSGALWEIDQGSDRV